MQLWVVQSVIEKAFTCCATLVVHFSHVHQTHELMMDVATFSKYDCPLSLFVFVQ